MNTTSLMRSYKLRKKKEMFVREQTHSYQRTFQSDPVFQRAYAQLQIKIEQLGNSSNVFQEQDCHKVSLMTRALADYKNRLILNEFDDTIAKGTE